MRDITYVDFIVVIVLLLFLFGLYFMASGLNDGRALEKAKVGAQEIEDDVLSNLEDMDETLGDIEGVIS